MRSVEAHEWAPGPIPRAFPPCLPHSLPAEAELILQKISIVAVIGHAGIAVVTGWMASQKGRSWVLPAVKGFLFGAMGLYEEQHTP